MKSRARRATRWPTVLMAVKKMRCCTRWPLPIIAGLLFAQTGLAITRRDRQAAGAAG